MHTVAPKRIETYGAINEEDPLDGESEVVMQKNFEEELRKETRIHPLLYSVGDSRGKSMSQHTPTLSTPTNDKQGPVRFTSSDFEPQFQPIQTPKVKRNDSDIVISGTYSGKSNKDEKPVETCITLWLWF